MFFPTPAQTALLRAVLVILFLSPIGALGCVWEPMGTGGFILSYERANWNWLAVFRSPPLSYTIRNFGKTIGFACHLLPSWFLASLSLPPWRWRKHVPSKNRLTFNGLYSVMCQKIQIFTRLFHKTRRWTKSGHLIFTTVMYHCQTHSEFTHLVTFVRKTTIYRAKKWYLCF
jgi:hypothetical protein